MLIPALNPCRAFLDAFLVSYCIPLCSSRISPLKLNICTFLQRAEREEFRQQIELLTVQLETAQSDSERATAALVMQRAEMEPLTARLDAALEDVRAAAARDGAQQELLSQADSRYRHLEVSSQSRLSSFQFSSLMCCPLNLKGGLGQHPYSACKLLGVVSGGSVCWVCCEPYWKNS